MSSSPRAGDPDGQGPADLFGDTTIVDEFAEPHPDRDPAPEVGAIWGDYRLVEPLAHGAAAWIYRAEHAASGRSVALKILRSHIAEHFEVVARFRREGELLREQDHPNLVEVIDVVSDGLHPPYLVMEYLPGLDLADYLGEKAPVDPATAVAIATGLCDALTAVHAIDIVHRDLKPENVFLVDTPRGLPTVKLLDFGVAKFLKGAGDQLITNAKLLLGTPEYMSPEQIHGHPIDARSDIYAVGMILYELLTGHIPFDAEQVVDLLQQHLEQAPPPFANYLSPPERDAIPGALERLVQRCLAKDPDARPQTTTALREALTVALLDMDMDVPSAKPPVAAIARAASSRTKFYLWAALALVAAAAAAVIIATVAA